MLSNICRVRVVAAIIFKFYRKFYRKFYCSCDQSLNDSDSVFTFLENMQNACVYY